MATLSSIVRSALLGSVGLLCSIAPLAVSGCDNRALALGDPTAIVLSLTTPFMDGTDDRLTTVAVFEGVETPDEQGDPTRFTLSNADFGQGVELESYEFLSNFRVELSIRRYAEAAAGARTIRMTLTNALGTFEATASLTLFNTLATE